MKRNRAIVLGGSVAIVVLAAGSAVAATRLGHHDSGTTLPKASCGAATTHALNTETSIITADPGALSCFDGAARACQPASVQVTTEGIDVGTAYVFRIESGGATCRVTQLSQQYHAPHGHGAVRSASCARTGVTLAGVTLTCEGREVLIPATVGQEHPGV